MTVEEVLKVIGTARKAVNDALYEVGNLQAEPEAELSLNDLSHAYRRVQSASVSLRNLQLRKERSAA